MQEKKIENEQKKQEQINLIDFSKQKKREKKKKQEKEIENEQKKYEQINLIDFSKQKKREKKKKQEKEIENGQQKQEQINLIDFSKQKKREKKKKQEKEIENQQKQKLTEFNQDKFYYQNLKRIEKMIRSNQTNQQNKKHVKLKTIEFIKQATKIICKQLNRDPAHLSAYFYSELGAQGSVANGQLILKYKLSQGKIQNLLTKYVHEYVICDCKSSNTRLQRDTKTRLQMLICNVCNSAKSVATIKNKKK